MQTTAVRPMTYHQVHWTRHIVKEAFPPYAKTVGAWLFPDGRHIDRRLWVRVPTKRGVKRAFTVDDLDTNIWIDAGRGAGSAVVDNGSLSLNVTHFPFDEPTAMRYTYTVVVTTQRESGGLVHEYNSLVNHLIPDLPQPWRGNVLVFRHGLQPGRPIINMDDGAEAMVEAILRKILRDRLVGMEDIGGQDFLADVYGARQG